MVRSRCRRASTARTSTRFSGPPRPRRKPLELPEGSRFRGHFGVLIAGTPLQACPLGIGFAGDFIGGSRRDSRTRPAADADSIS